MASEETRISAPKVSESNEIRPRKIQHKNENILDFKAMLSNMKAMNVYSCKECGMSFCTSENQ